MPRFGQVVWNVAFYTYLGESEGNPLVYAIKLIFGGLGIGIAFWLATLFWMSRLNRRHGHTDGTIQVALTLTLTLTLTRTLTRTRTRTRTITLTLTPTLALTLQVLFTLGFMVHISWRL